MAALVVLILDGVVTSSAVVLTDAQQLFIGTAVAVATLWILLIHEDRQDRRPVGAEAGNDGPMALIALDGSPADG